MWYRHPSLRYLRQKEEWMPTLSRLLIIINYLEISQIMLVSISFWKSGGMSEDFHQYVRLSPLFLCWSFIGKCVYITTEREKCALNWSFKGWMCFCVFRHFVFYNYCSDIGRERVIQLNHSPNNQEFFIMHVHTRAQRKSAGRSLWLNNINFAMNKYLISTSPRH
jgi:hypothetical protein